VHEPPQPQPACGEELGKGRKLEDIQREMGLVVAEGVTTASSAYDLARRAGVETPIIDEGARLAFTKNKDPRRAVRDLMLARRQTGSPLG